MSVRAVSACLLGRTPHFHFNFHPASKALFPALPAALQQASGGP